MSRFTLGSRSVPKLTLIAVGGIVQEPLAGHVKPRTAHVVRRAPRASVDVDAEAFVLDEHPAHPLGVELGDAASGVHDLAGSPAPGGER